MNIEYLFSFFLLLSIFSFPYEEDERFNLCASRQSWMNCGDAKTSHQI